jgi:putative hemolysin
VLKHRATGLAAPIRMSDALARNAPKLSDGVEELIANCLAHGGGSSLKCWRTSPKSAVMCWSRWARRIEEKLIVRGDHTMEGGMAAAETLIALKTPPTAIMCSNDMLAIGVLHRLSRHGLRVPDDIVRHLRNGRRSHGLSSA